MVLDSTLLGACSTASAGENTHHRPTNPIHNQTKIPYRQACLHVFFEEQAQRTPDAVALIYQEEKITYEELNRRAERLARVLCQWGVGPEVLVGMCLPRTPDLIVAILGIQKAGGAYVPLDPAYPPERIAFMLQDTQAPVLLTSQALLPHLPATKAHCFCMDRDWDSIDDKPSTATRRSATPQNLAYIIYTSGSTGRPKGVAITHSNASALLAWAIRIFPRQDLQGVLAATSVCFDLSVYEIFLPLRVGGTIVLAENALQLPTLPHRQEVTLINTVPSAMAELARTHGLPASVRIVNLAGEPLRRVLVEKIYGEFSHVEAVYNLYGPSEDTTYSTWARISRDDSLEPSIGIPIDNTQAYILDANLQPVAVDQIGELYLGGDGVSRGYLNRPDLTAERYLPDPFGTRPGARLYRTGDLSRYRPDGEIEFLGRADHQVKIRGFRIELGEIEAALSRHPHIESQVVMAHAQKDGENRLIAYFVARQDTSLSLRELRQHLQTKLPTYMLPSLFVRLDKMPLNPNGKIDRKALPSPERATVEHEEAYVAPRTPDETLLAQIWGEVLGLERIGIHDDFFELGGHSLLAMQVLTRVRDRLHVHISQRALFDAPTIAGLAAVIEGTEERSLPLPPVQAGRRPGHLPLSIAQQEMWFMEHYAPGIPLYNVPAVFIFQGELQVALLEKALNEVVRRHESLHTVFQEIDHQPVQIILPPAPIPFEFVDLQGLPAAERNLTARKRMLEVARQPLDIQHGPLVKALLVKLAPDRHQLLLNSHHIITDGWTTGLILKELAAIYAAYKDGTIAPLPESPIQFADAAIWQNDRWQEENELQQEQTFWQEHFGGELTPVVFPSDRPRPPRQTYHGARLSHTLPAGLIEALETFARQANASLFMVMLAAFKVLLYRYTGQTDITVCTPTASRNQTEFESVAGLFVNTLPLRNDLSGEPSFQELLARVRHTTLEFLSHQDFPCSKILDSLKIPRGNAYNPLLQYMFAVQNVPVDRVCLPDLSIRFTEELDSGTSKMLLSLFVEFTEATPVIVAEYNTDLFDEASIARLLQQYQCLLQSITNNPSQPISSLPLLPGGEQGLLLETWNDTAQGFPAACLHQLVSAQAQRTPQAVALRFQGQILSYADLESRANRLAHTLQGLGIGPNRLVAVCLERSFEMVIGLLGVLKAGGAYLPLDPDLPTERLAYMLADAGAVVLITSPGLRSLFPRFSGTVLFPDANRIGEQPGSVPADSATPEDLAYVIYTSGSTGRPKGIPIHHRGAVNFLDSMRQEPGLSAGETIVSLATYSFDISVLEIFLPLIAGGQVSILSREVASDGLQLREALEQSGAAIVQATPPTWRMLLDAGWQGDPNLKILCGAEALPQDLADALCERVASLWNLYGPTETTVWCTLMRLEKGKPVRIGRPIHNMQCYVLDAHQQLVPVGAVGELYISGTGTSYGYLNRPDLTAEKFIAHPFKSGERIYRTGDLARFHSDGSLEYLGRTDFQVKVRGFRIELGEIENTLARHPAVKAAVVIAHQQATGPQLVAYFTPAQMPAPDAGELRNFLRQSLPDYMIPAAYICLEAFPLTATRKINRLALPAPEFLSLSEEQDFVAPSTPFEEILADIFREVLHVENISVHHNFFDLGGHSLLATQVMSRIYNQLEVKLPVRALFDAPTLGGLAARVEQAVLAMIHSMDESKKEQFLSAP